MSHELPSPAIDAHAAARIALLAAWCTRVGREDGGASTPAYVVGGPKTAARPDGETESIGEDVAATILAATPKPLFLTARQMAGGASAVVAIQLSVDLPPAPTDPVERIAWQAPERRAALLADAYTPRDGRAPAVLLVAGGRGRVRCHRSALVALARDYRLLLPWSLAGGAPDDAWTVGLPLTPAERAGVDYVFLLGRSRGNGSSAWIAVDPPPGGDPGAPSSARAV